MIIWSGLGVLVPVMALTVFIFCQVAIDAIFGDGYMFDHAWSLLLTGVACGAALWFTGKRLNRPSGRVLVDEVSGERVQLKPNHSFFFIPIQYWAFAALALGVLMAYLSLSSRP